MLALREIERDERFVRMVHAQFTLTFERMPSAPCRLGHDYPTATRHRRVHREIASPLLDVDLARTVVDRGALSGLDPRFVGEVARVRHRLQRLIGCDADVHAARDKGAWENVPVFGDLIRGERRARNPRRGQLRVRRRQGEADVHQRQHRRGQIVDAVRPHRLRHAPKREGVVISRQRDGLIAARIFESVLRGDVRRQHQPLRNDAERLRRGHHVESGERGGQRFLWNGRSKVRCLGASLRDEQRQEKRNDDARMSNRCRRRRGE